MADEKTFSETEHIAILADRVQTETASLTVELDQLKSEKAELETKLDVAESAKVAAETAKAEAEKALEDFKAEVAEREAAAVRKDERISKLREAAKHLNDEFFADENRVARIIAMDDEAFEGYVSDLSVGAPASGSTVAPRETAMDGDPVVTPVSKSAARDFLLGSYNGQEG